MTRFKIIRKLWRFKSGCRHGGRLPRVESEMSHAVQRASGSVHHEIREEGEAAEMSERSHPLANFERT